MSEDPQRKAAAVQLPVTVVHTSSGMCLTTAVYSHWREVQDAFEDYKASLGPYEVDDLIEYLGIEYPTNPPFEAQDVRRLAREPGAYIWAVTADPPEGPGLCLGMVTGDSLRLAIAGRQFPDADDRDQRDSWYQVEGGASIAGRSWTFAWPALTCDVAPHIVRWLLDTAHWLRRQPESAVGPPPPWLVEPCLQFGSPERVNGRSEIAVELDLEFLPPERRATASVAGKPECLRLRATVEELEQAAIDFAATVAPFSVEPSASWPTT